MPERLDEFIHHENVRNYSRQLAGELTVEQRKIIEALLAAENEKARRARWAAKP